MQNMIPGKLYEAAEDIPAHSLVTDADADCLGRRTIRLRRGDLVVYLGKQCDGRVGPEWLILTSDGQVVNVFAEVGWIFKEASL